MAVREGERAAPRRPGAVPDDDGDLGPDDAADVRGGVDTDGDGRPDTVLTVDGTDLLVCTDLDGDGLTDRMLRIGPDGAVRPVLDDGDGPVPAAHSLWDGLLGPGP